MDYARLTAPCGLDCFNCVFYLAQESREARAVLERNSRLNGLPVDMMLCRGCRDQAGLIELHRFVSSRAEDEPCPAFECTQKKGLDFCCQCDDFPCDVLHPCADRAEKVPHNTKVFNLCLIRKMGLEEWAKHKAARVRETYFHKWWSL